MVDTAWVVETLGDVMSFMSCQHSGRGVLRAIALVAGGVVSIASPGWALDNAPASPTELRNRVDECYTRVKGVSQITRATLTFEIGEAGALIGAPETTATYGSEAGAQKLAAEGSSAIASCAPYGYRPGLYVVTVAPNGVAGAVPHAARRAYAAHLASTNPASAALKLGAQPISAETTAAAVSEAQEEALDFAWDVKQEIQVRLRLAGHNPGGADGMFGQATRTAIADWQSARGLPVSGFIDMAQLGILRTETAVSYANRAEPEYAPRPVQISPQEVAPEPTRRRVKVCQRDVFGQLVNCRIEYR